MRRDFTVFMFCIALALVIGASIASAGNRVVRITNGDWPPFLGENLPGNGALSEIAREAFALQGIEVEYGFFPWARSLAIAASEEWDGSIGWVRTEERTRDFLFSDDLVDQPVILFSLKNKKVDWTDFKDLEGLSIGVTLGYHYGDEFERAREQALFRVDVSRDDETSIRKLLGERVDAAAVDMSVGIELIKRRFPQEAGRIWYSENPVRSAPYHLLFSKKAPKAEELLKAFNQGLAKLKESGRYQQIMDEMEAGQYSAP